MALCAPSSGLMLWADVEAPRHELGLNLVAQVAGRGHFSSQRPAAYIHRDTQSTSAPAAPMFSGLQVPGRAWCVPEEASVVGTEEG